MKYKEQKWAFNFEEDTIFILSDTSVPVVQRPKYEIMFWWKLAKLTSTIEVEKAPSWSV